MNTKIPQDRCYSEEHEWLKLEGELAIIGISDHAQKSLGDVVYVELPEPGREISKGSVIGVVESVKAVSDIYAPASGLVKAVNQAVLDRPELVNQDPYNQGWLLKIAVLNPNEITKHLLSPENYEKLLEKEAK